MWNEHLAARASTYSTGVLSIVDADGYPMSVRCTACLDASRQVFTFPSPPSICCNSGCLVGTIRASTLPGVARRGHLSPMT